ncbi:MAG: hypothetical protein AAFP76_07075 [Bacteroidota bacterium]
MRTIKSIALTFALLVGTTLSATNPVGDKVKKEEATQEIAVLLENPEFELKQDTSADVKLTVNSEGELVVLCVTTENNLVERHIKSRLNYQKLENALEKGKSYTLSVIITSEA